MACYLGCATKRNKILWGTFAALVLVGAIFIAVGLSRVPPCRNRQPPQCRVDIARSRNQPLDPACRNSFANCLRPWLVMAGIGAVALATALITTCVMCCCNKTPKEQSAQQYHTGGPTHGVQMVAPPVHQFHPYAQQQQQQQYDMPAHPYAAGSPYQSTQQQQGPPAGYPYQQQQQQSWQQQQQSWQQQQQLQQAQQGTPFAAQPAAPYPPQPHTASNVPVQQI